jgi:hypothetical protein
MPGTLRSADEARSLLIRRDTDLVQLQLPIDDAAAVQYRVAVRTAEDREIWSQDGLQSQNMPAGKAIVLSLPANLLPAGDYVVLVRAVTASGDIEDAGQFSFKTVRR